jgi:hypothetical protein
MEAIAKTVTAFQACALAHDRIGAQRLFTSLGLSWMFAPSDPFAAEKSPAQWLRNSTSSGNPATPLEIIDARLLPDGRIGIVVVDQAVGPEYLAQSSLWFMIEKEGSWYIDGIIGFQFYVPPRYPTLTPTPMLIATPESSSSN